jgi:hypothetical protein
LSGMEPSDPDKKVIWDRFDHLERRVNFIAKIAIPAFAFVVAWVVFEALVLAMHWESQGAYQASLFVFAGVWFWLFWKQGRLK